MEGAASLRTLSVTMSLRFAFALLPLWRCVRLFVGCFAVLPFGLLLFGNEWARVPFVIITNVFNTVSGSVLVVGSDGCCL